MLAPRKSPKQSSKPGATRLRDSERTRERLLQAASREIYRSGYQSASLDTILAVAGVTKGALYYHFDSKEALDTPSLKRSSPPTSAASGCAPYKAARTLSTL